ncbi:MAG TPA: thiamine diphosphokinase [Treponema sp.]|nr:thiamine diphosphokinase [Treponema sp.]
MLGIVFAGGKGPPPELIRQIISDLKTEALLAAADSGLELAEEAGLKPDWIIGDMDSLANPARLEAYSPERIIRHSNEKDYSDTELAVDFLREKGCGEIWIAGGGGGRIDHLFAVRSLFERDFAPRRWISDTADIYRIEPCEKLSLSIASGAIVSVFPLGAGPWSASSAGLKWPLVNLPWNRGFFGLSNVAQNGEFMIHSLEGRFMVLMPYMSF